MSTSKASQEKKKYEKKKKKKNWKIKKRDKKKKEKKVRKKRYTQKFIKKGVQYTLPNEKENRYMIQKNSWKMTLLVTTCGWWSLFKNKTQKNIFWAFISFSSQPYNADHVTSPIKSILIIEWLQWFSYSLAL